MSKKATTVDVFTMGCSKNLVDSERLLAMFARRGIEARHNPARAAATAAVVNTCGFIGDAKEESIEMILSLVRAKNDGRIGKLYVMGCLSERYLSELQTEIPEVDAWFGKFNWDAIVDCLTHEQQIVADSKVWERQLTGPSHSAYIKISEGCNRHCAFCAIPLITGRHTSRPMEQILEETAHLAAKGVKEFNVIAQDLSSYGLDTQKRLMLPELIDSMARISGVEWIRLHYAYPAQFPMDLLPVMAEHDNVCKYLDIALQHISDPVLKNMRRNITADETRRLINNIRGAVKDIHLRTTLMVGFPGEGEREFEELLDFVEQTRFERMGAFAYCEEENTPAARLFKDSVPSEEKQRRLDILMERQQEISAQIQQQKVGKTLKVLIDRAEEDYYVGRTQWDSPEVDPEVLVKKRQQLHPGHFYDVKITEASPFELYGEV